MYPLTGKEAEEQVRDRVVELLTTVTTDRGPDNHHEGVQPFGMAITNLPDDVLQQMFARESVADRCALACTCKRFRDLSLTAGFWGNVELDVGRVQVKSNAGMAAMLHFLAKRVTHQTKMSLECSSAPPVDPLRPADTCSWPDISIVPLLMGVGINPGITVLTLNLNNLSLGMQTEILRILPWLTALRELTINDIYLADSSQLNAFKVLSRLERLALKFNPQAAALVRQSLQGGFPEKFANLTQLKHLAIHRAGFLGDLPQQISALTNLRALDLSSGSILTGLPTSISALSQLAAVKIEHYGSDNLAALAWLPSMRELHLSSQRIPVELASCSQLTALTLLLGNVPEHQIECGFKRMLGFGQQSASWRSLLPKATADAPKLHDQLQVLHVANTKLSSVPQAVTQLPNLELLSLTHCSLFDLPAGPYISKLRTLVLKQNFFIEIPKSLAGAAPRLRRLDMSHNLLRPSEMDIDTVLQLPSLQNLWVTKTVPQSGPERFRQNLGNSWTAYSVQCLFKLAARHAALHQGCPPLTINIFEASPTDL